MPDRERARDTAQRDDLSSQATWLDHRERTWPNSIATRFAGYTITYLRDVQQSLPDRTRRGALLEISRDGTVLRTEEPALTSFPNQPQAVATPAVWTTPSQDLYIALSRLETGSISVNLSTHPFMWLLWASGALVMVGGLWALSGRRRTPAAEELEAVARA